MILVAAVATASAGQVGVGPVPPRRPDAALPEPRDRPFDGAIRLKVDATDGAWNLLGAGDHTRAKVGRDMKVEAHLRTPRGMRAFTALDPTGAGDAGTSYAPVTLERLVDSSVYAGRFSKQVRLTTDGRPAVLLDLLADEPADLALDAAAAAKLRLLVQQTTAVFGPPPFRRYEMIASLSDALSPGGGIEHLEEGENNLPSDYLRAPGGQLDNLDLIAHELVHARTDATDNWPIFGRRRSTSPRAAACFGSMRVRPSLGDASLPPAPASEPRSRRWTSSRSTQRSWRTGQGGPGSRWPTARTTPRTWRGGPPPGGTGSGARTNTPRAPFSGWTSRRACGSGPQAGAGWTTSPPASSGPEPVTGS